MQNYKLFYSPYYYADIGEYAADIADTVEIHSNTIRAVKEVYFGAVPAAVSG